MTTTRESPVLSVENLVKEYGESTTAVDGVSVTVERGEVVGLLGPNGAGKTTTIKCAVGLTEPTSGQVRVAGVDPHAEPTAVYREVAAMLEGARNVYWRLTVRENLRFFTGLNGTHPNDATAKHDRLLSKLDLEEKADEPARELSRGMKQKLSFACTLVRETPLVFLDEPTLGLDVTTNRELRVELTRLAEEENRAVVLSSHNMEVIRAVCDRVIILDDGHIVADDSVSELLDVFQQQVCRVQVADPERIRGQLDDSDGLEAVWDDSTARVKLAGPEAFHTLTGALAAADATVESFETVDPDLESVFLDITGEQSDESATVQEGLA
jgi:ABC-2 type transport system ATP-binding protein